MEGDQIQVCGLAYIPTVLGSYMHTTYCFWEGGSFFLFKSVEPMVQEFF